MKLVVAAFNQENALVGAFSVITNLRICFGWTFLEHYTEARLAVARLCPHLQHLLNFSDHCKDVLQNLLSQLSVLLGGKDKSPVKLSPGDYYILLSNKIAKEEN